MVETAAQLVRYSSLKMRQRDLIVITVLAFCIGLGK